MEFDTVVSATAATANTDTTAVTVTTAAIVATAVIAIGALAMSVVVFFQRAKRCSITRLYRFYNYSHNAFYTEKRL
jgi:hypothetical protein